MLSVQVWAPVETASAFRPVVGVVAPEAAVLDTSITCESDTSTSVRGEGSVDVQAMAPLRMATISATGTARVLLAAALIFGLFAWWLYDDNRAERSLLNAVVAAMFLAMAIYGVVVPALTPLFPSSEIARALRNVVCVGPKAAAAGFQEPSLVFMTGTSTLLTDGSGAADFLAQGSCRFALIEKRAERNFAQRAEAIGLRYELASRVEGYNISQGRPISIAIFRSEGTE